MSPQPWASGPSEILQHSLSLLSEDSDKNRRLAFLSIDNAVELTIKTYLSLPKRVTGLSIGRNKLNEISESFPQLLDALEEHASDKLTGIDLGEIEWYHRLRNQLYHQGNGLTVESDKVHVYAQLAKLLFRNLFGIDILVEHGDSSALIGSFLQAWSRYERIASALIAKSETGIDRRGLQPMFAVRKLQTLGLIDRQTAHELEHLRSIRNGVAHGVSKSISGLNKEMIVSINQIATRLERAYESGFGKPSASNPDTSLP